MEIFIKGNYQSFTKLIVTKSKRPTTNVLLQIHGIYGVTGDKGSKSKYLSNKVVSEGLAHSVNFSSSRDWSIYSAEDRNTQISSFQNKTFQQEADDISDAITLIFDQSNELFGIKKEDLALWVVANSIGGTVLTTLSGMLPKIKKIVVCGSGTGSSSSSKPILSTCPLLKQILESATHFHGKILLLQGSLDDTVPLPAQNDLLSGYINADRHKKVIDGANHNFGKINGKNKSLAQKLYVETIIEFLRT